MKTNPEMVGKRILECPICKSKDICHCPGSTCLIPIQSINWICIDCLKKF